jgi:hypothetical protein
LIAAGVGAVMVVAAIIWVALALTGGDGGVDAASQGKPNPPAVTTPLAEDPPPVEDQDEVPPAEDDPPADDPPADTRPDNWFRSGSLGLGFELPAGWQATTATDAVGLASRDGSAVGVLSYYPKEVTADIRGDTAKAVRETSQLLSIGTGTYAYDEVLDDLGGPFDWYVLSFTVPSDQGGLTSVSVFVADAERGGSYQIHLVAEPGAGNSVWEEARTILATMTPE